MKKIILFVVTTLMIHGASFAQKFTIQSLQIGYRIYEMGSVGNNPYTISSFLKNPEAYGEMINQYETNGLWGGGIIYVPKQYYVNVELGKTASKYSLQTGFFIGSQLSKRMALTNHWKRYSDSLFMDENYIFNQTQRFVGLNLGLRRRFMLAKNINFLVGLEAEGRTTIEHNFTQQKETRWYGGESKVEYEDLPSFKGKSILQGHLMLPVGFEYTQKFISLRVEGFIGFLDDKYRSDLYLQEGHGLSFWLGYKF